VAVCDACSDACSEIRDVIIELDAAGLDARQRRLVIEQMGHHKSLGEAAFWGLDSERDNESLHDLQGWPECECTACGCSEPATCTDDGGVAVCDACSDYTIDADGEVHCSQCDDTEVVSDSWGRSITRIKPPEEPETDPEGKYACYWDTCGNEAHVVARYPTRESAEQAVAAKDWPGPGDSTNYLCGYVVRELVDGEWVRPEEDR
jgi:hypothetical protein